MFRQQGPGDEQQHARNRAGDDRWQAAGFHVTDNPADNRQHTKDEEVKFCRVHVRAVAVIQPPKTVQRRDYSVPRASMTFRCFDSAFDRNLATFLGALVSVSPGKTLLRRCRSCASGGAVRHTALYL